MKKKYLVMLSALALFLLSACAPAISDTPAAATQPVIDLVSTQVAQTLEALASSVPPATVTVTAEPTNTEAATATLTVTDTLTALPTETETLPPTSTLTTTPAPTTAALPFACNPDGVGISHIEVTNSTGQSVTVYISSNNCFKQINIADSEVVTVAVPIATYVVYGYREDQSFFSVSGYVSDTIHTWFVRIYPDSAVMIGP